MAEGGQLRVSRTCRTSPTTSGSGTAAASTMLTETQPNAKFLVPMDVQQGRRHRGVMAERPKSEFGQIDFLLHSIAFASLDDLKRDTIETSREGLQAGDGDQRL